jgi:hypothetical protein
MNKFSDLDQYISREYPDDYWADEAILYASEIIRELSSDDWRVLGKIWRKRDEQWQVRCAQILPHGEQGHAVKLLVDMVKHGNHEVRIAALDSMRETALEKLSPADLDYVSYEVNQIMVGASVTEATVLKNMLVRLKNSCKLNTLI